MIKEWLSYFCISSSRTLLWEFIFRLIHGPVCVRSRKITNRAISADKTIIVNRLCLLIAYLVCLAFLVTNRNRRFLYPVISGYFFGYFLLLPVGLSSSKALQTAVRAFSPSFLSTMQLMRISLVVMESMLTFASASELNILSAMP